jgi:transposase InsO family protein
MRLSGVSVRQQRLEMVTAVDRGVSVTDICSVYGVSRQTFYKWRNRYLEEGPEGLEDRSSRPLRSAGVIASRTEARLVEMRMAHPRWGPRRLRKELELLGGYEPLPARSTIGAVLVRNGLVDRAATRAEEPATVRFERRRSNELWQMDGVEVAVAGRVVEVITCLDDHSRLCPSLYVADAETAETVIAAFDRAAQAGYGLPYSVLSDRGGAFTGRTSGSVSQFERHLWQQGIATLNGRAYHPQTQGKVERFHRTLREWLADWQAAHGPLRDIASLEWVLELFRVDYNTRRPPQALHDRTPQERFDAAVKATPDPAATAHLRQRVTVRHTSPNGNLAYADWTIGTGRGWANTTVVITDYGSHIDLHHPDGTLIRTVKPDYTRTYLGTGKPRGRPTTR